MAVQISILVDDNQQVQVLEAGSSDIGIRLVEVLERWKRQAAEPCPAGQKCKILKQWIADIENLLQ